jgi:aminoglycoside phosphotransferase (APT) family kinase protein
VIDWERCGLGPPELDAGMFLACLTWRGGHAEWAEQVGRARRAFEAGIAGRMDRRAVAWHEAAALLCRASRQVRRPHRHGKARAQAMVEAAARLAAAD